MAETETRSTVTYSRFFELAVKRSYKRLLLMQWTAPTRRHLGAKMRLLLLSGLSPLMAKTYRSGHARYTSAYPSASDILAAMSGFDPIPSGLHSGPDVAGATGIRRVLTHCRHSPKRKAAPKDRSGTLFRPPQIEAQSSSRFTSPRRAPTLEPGSAVCENRYSLALQRAPPRTWAISPFSSSNGSRVAR